jgi:arginine deiminase
VTTEIEALRCVVVHRPGDEVARMTQHQLDHLLFDDILSPSAAMEEHDLMTAILRGAGAEVLDIRDLLVEALTRASGRERQALIEAVADQAGAAPLADLVRDWPADRLAQALIEGIAWGDLDETPMTLARLRRQLDRSDDEALAPVPNLMFMRDPCMTVHDRVVVGRMATGARAREPLLVSFAVSHAPAVLSPRRLFDDTPGSRHSPNQRLEGGDVLVISPEFLVVGCSQRTSAHTVERLAREAIFDAFPAVQRVYAVLMPEQRSIMHLDTVITQIDRHLFLGHEPLVAGARACPVARLERSQPAALIEGATLVDVLREELGEVTLVPCGGTDPVHQEREQWTDGANALCLAPGKIILYARNVQTIEALGAEGFEETSLHVLQPAEQRAELIAEGMKRDRTVFSVSGSELSRARGGARCLTMPMLRGDGEA